MRRISVLLPALLILAAGCVATRDWVRETVTQKETAIGQRVDQQFEQRDAKIGERIGGVEGRVSSEAQRIDGVGQRIDGVGQKLDGVGQRLGTVETSVGEASAAAAGARELGVSSQAKADGVDRRLTRIWTNRHNPKVVDTVELYFGFDRWDLDDGAQTALAALVKELLANSSLTVELMGYTDTKGARQYNYQLSQRRVESVRRFLAEKGIGLSRIQAVGFGPITAEKTPDAQKRRVTAKLLLDQD
jgi:outer membrane protein OmpA-like peptidoglycan-associated protein